MDLDILKTIWDVAEQIMSNSQYVAQGSEEAKKAIASEIQEYSFNKKKLNIPNIPISQNKDATIIGYELTAASVNYCYWHGRCDVRANNSSSRKMYQLLDESYTEADSKKDDKSLLGIFTQKLICNRFPLIDKRIKHLQELRYSSGYILKLLEYIDIDSQIKTTGNKIRSFEDCFRELFFTCPGFAEDIFSKRAILFFTMLHRRMGWFKKDIHKLPVSVGCHIPKMLRKLNCIKYYKSVPSSLESRILKNGDIIIPGSREENEIRAASILACRDIAEMANCFMCDVDSFLWDKRKTCKDPFHLTITTNY